MGKDTLSGKKKYTNGVIAKYFVPGEQPQGWVLGSTQEKIQKNSQATKKLWQDKEFRDAQMRTRYSQGYHDSLVQRNKESWKLNHKRRSASLKVAAQKRWQSDVERANASNRMHSLWAKDEYRTSQTKSLGDGHKDIYIEHPEYLEKIALGNTQTWENNHESILQKQAVSKTKNRSWNFSKAEELLLEKLLQTHQPNDIVRQYRDPVRYPFYCDFYIISEDKFIELNKTWTHGGRPFDPNDEECQKQLAQWQEKAQTSLYYRGAITTWTERDVLKRSVALQHNLNIEFIY